MAFLGLKLGQDLENQAAHPHQEFPGVPPRVIVVLGNSLFRQSCLLNEFKRSWWISILFVCFCVLRFVRVIFLFPAIKST